MDNNLSPYNPTPGQAVRISQLREAAWHMQDLIRELCPDHIKRERALLLLADALHNANRAILEGEDKQGEESGNTRHLRTASKGND